jgi:hypothetical protein
MPDGFNHFTNRTSDLIGILEKPLLDNEINVIKEFVEEGGKLLIDGIGILRNEFEEYNFVNSTMLNPLIEDFGITFNSNPIPFPLQYNQAYPVQTTPLTRNVTSITQFGNYLEVTSPGLTLTQSPNGKATSAIYQNINGGKVLVTSTNYWLDNNGINGDYMETGGGIDDLNFVGNMVDWFGQEEILYLTADVSENNVRTLSFLTSSPEFIIESSTDYSVNMIEEGAYEVKILGTHNYKFAITLNDLFLNLDQTNNIGVSLRIEEYQTNKMSNSIAVNSSIRLTGKDILDYKIAVYLNDIQLQNSSISVDHVNN